MAVTATSPVREHEKPMSWARAMLIAVGFFFAAAILLGQFPSYVFTISTLANLARMEQGFLDLALLSIGIGLLCFEISMLYDPKPVLPLLAPLFALVGLGIGAVGLGLVYQVSVGVNGTDIFGQPGWSELQPNGPHSYLIHPAWFQQGTIDLAAVGMIALLIGGGMFGFAVLNPLVLAGRLVGPVRDLLVRFSIGLSVVIVAVWLSVYTFFPHALDVALPAGGGKVAYHPGPGSNVFLFIALMTALFALQVWLLPVMVANRQQFMPGVYLHGVVGLIGNVGVPFLIIWAALYPVVNLVHNLDTNSFWVQCSEKSYVPGSCTFTPFTGYIICAMVYGAIFGLFMLGLYFWSTRRNTIVLGGTIGLLWVGLAATLIHVDDPDQLPLGMIIAIGVALTAFIYTWSTQREFASTQVQQLGCAGQWLVLGTLMLMFIFGFAFFSIPSFFEVEALALVYQPGQGGLHDAFWVLLLMGGLAALQFTFLLRRRQGVEMGVMRKFALWVMLGAIVLEIAASIMGFHRDALSGGFNAFEGAHAVFFGGILLEIVGIGAALMGAVRAKSFLSLWPVVIVVSALVGLAIAVVAYNLPSPYPELVEFGFIFGMAGALAYTAGGTDYVDPYEAALLQGNGAYNGNGGGYQATR